MPPKEPKQSKNAPRPFVPKTAARATVGGGGISSSPRIGTAVTFGGPPATQARAAAATGVAGVVALQAELLAFGGLRLPRPETTFKKG